MTTNIFDFCVVAQRTEDASDSSILFFISEKFEFSVQKMIVDGKVIF